uniref:Synaptogyrin 3b n=1 Tax=Salarias fasciatus TaxID=181472 RepID=A0A672GLP7_SALFA
MIFLSLCSCEGLITFPTPSLSSPGDQSHSDTRASSFSPACQLIKRPACLSPQVFSIVVFSCIVNEGYINIGSERLLCIFNKNADACNYGITVGVTCFLGSICFLILDIYFPTMSNVRDRRRAVLVDLVFSGVSSFLWFVGFCFLANQWQATSPDELPLAQGSDAARATIAFCFFSILTWVSLDSFHSCTHFVFLFVASASFPCWTMLYCMKQTKPSPPGNICYQNESSQYVCVSVCMSDRQPYSN